ncbi:MAG: NAD-dependent epimerase/dehydratase family protein [Coxiellaceae bacterium]|jgi:UDP-glucose 4-epimerase|nr:NAD-dependent epimerase/dehydratase family protein [Coxiellaceae bacterium]
MKIFITGGAGFIGSHLTDRLLARNDKVLIIDNFSTGRRDNLKEHANLQIIEDSICNENTVLDLMSDFKPDLIIHAAASYKDPNNWLEDSLTNTVGTVIICQAAQKNNIKRLIYFQTALCYGLKPIEHPITLNHPILPEGSSYAISKTTGEEYIHLSGLDYVTFRLANAYGPRNISGPLPTFYKRLTTNQPCFIMDTRRDFVYIDDMVDCIMHAVDGSGHGTYHISSGNDVSIMELFEATTLALNMQIKIEVKQRQPDDVYSILLDPSKTINEFGWHARIPLNVGVKRTIEYYQKFGINRTFTHLQEVKK